MVHEVAEKSESFRQRESGNTFVQDEEAVPCPIDTYMQIKRLEKIYVPMNMAYEETQDIQEMLETRSSKSKYGFTGIYFNRNRPKTDKIDEVEEIV